MTGQGLDARSPRVRPSSRKSYQPIVPPPVTSMLVRRLGEPNLFPFLSRSFHLQISALHLPSHWFAILAGPETSPPMQRAGRTRRENGRYRLVGGSFNKQRGPPHEAFVGRQQDARIPAPALTPNLESL